ncbi:MAG: right-handed parallel beta-helix repeat-containing protein [Planctomycetota bacterium]|jgi:hypothetical protein
MFQIKLTAVLGVLAASSTAGAQVLYVDDDASAGGDGLGWNTAYRFLQGALAVAAAAGGAITEIRVAQGTYVPDATEATPLGTGDRLATFQLLDDVALLGGYAGPEEANPDARDVEFYETSLSGDIGDPGLAGDNSFTVVTASGTDGSAVLDGFTITAGQADGPDSGDLAWRRGAGIWNLTGSPTIGNCTVVGNYAQTAGAGMYNHTGSSPTVDHCTFQDNVAADGNAGGMLNYIDSHPMVSNCVFTNNVAGGSGGGMNNINGSSPTITGCAFTNNQGVSGGGMHNNVDSHPLITACTFTGNSATTYNGGGMVNHNASHPTIIGCEFVANTTSAGGGWGGGMHNREGSNPLIIDCLFADNVSSYNGGGMSNFIDTAALIVNSLFIGNAAGHVGGGLHLREYADALVVNCLFTGNSAGDHSGGGVRSSKWSSPSFVNCTFSGNSAPVGGGLAAGSDTSGDIGHAQVRNCVLWGNTASFGREIALNGDFPSDLTVSYSDVQGGEADVYVQPGFTLNWGPGNIDADPLFADAGNGDYRLSAGSPCIDAGHNWHVPSDGADLDIDADTEELTPLDLGGGPRFADDPATADSGCGAPAVVDMGAYELLGTPAPHPVRLGDLDGDGVVGVLDFLALLASWGPCEDGCCLADLDLDGVVGVVDFLILLANWG